MYETVWTPVLGEELTLQTEDGNQHDKHTVAVMKECCIASRMPRSISKV